MKTLVTSSVQKAAQAIRAGQVVAFPTETVYGLGANAFDARAVLKIFAAKGRPADNPIIVHLHSMDQLPLVASRVPPIAVKLARKFFPGPLSLVLEKSPRIPLEVTGGLNTVCVRMPSLSLTRRFLKACKTPVAAPSANLSGKPSPTTWQHALHDLNGRIPVILKGPQATHGTESTVVDCTVNPPRLLRPGALPLEELEQAVGRIRVPGKLRKAVSPGLHYRHYAPEGKLRIVTNASGLLLLKKTDASISLSPSSAGYAVRVKTPTEYARRLYSFLRECDQLKIKRIYAQLPPEKGIGRAVCDRLARAARKS